MKKIDLTKIAKEIPVLECDEMGSLTGGFAELGLSQGEDEFHNTTCKNNGKCTFNSTCKNNSRCDGNMNCNNQEFCSGNGKCGMEDDKEDDREKEP